MMVSDNKTREVFNIRFCLEEDIEYPKFTIGKLYHIIQNVCSHYTGHFSFKKNDGGYVYDDGKLIEGSNVIVKVSGVNDDEVNNIAADLCAFFALKEVTITKEIMVYRTVSESLDI